MRISWVLLTHNRSLIVEKSLAHNIKTAGAEIHELVWCDNGSEPLHYAHLRQTILADTHIRNRTNLGVARGYNQAMGLATGTHIVITGCDMLMPDNWLKTFIQYEERIANTGMALMYSKPLAECPERLRGPRQRVNGLDIIPAFPVERRFFKRAYLHGFGYFPEVFGLYGFEDLALAHRIEKICMENGLLSYLIPDHVPVHLGTEGVEKANGGDSEEYHLFKRRESSMPEKRAMIDRLREMDWPRFSPFL